MAKIFLTALPSAWPNDVLGYALCEDGTCLATHLSSGASWAKHDMGLTSDWHHDKYREHCPEGFELVWIDDPSSSKEWQAALVKNKARAAESETSNHVTKPCVGKGPVTVE